MDREKEQEGGKQRGGRDINLIKIQICSMNYLPFTIACTFYYKYSLSEEAIK